VFTLALERLIDGRRVGSLAVVGTLLALVGVAILST
jgi:drug/metabolite transporter (DMT)-like permease